MILTFSRDSFVESILNGTKKHTIRQDISGRWKRGMKIHFWRGNPRNVKSNPYQFGEGLVRNAWPIYIVPEKDRVIFQNPASFVLPVTALNRFAIADGFKSWEDMKEFFKEPFTGKIIFWTECNFSNQATPAL